MSYVERGMRLGVYIGLAAVKLGDDSYARRFHDRPITEVSEAEYLQVATEIQRKLVEAGIIQLDEDPFDEVLERCVEQAGGEEKWFTACKQKLFPADE